MQHIFVTRIYPKHPDVYKISVGHKNVTGICYMLLIIKFAKNGRSAVHFDRTGYYNIYSVFQKNVACFNP